MSAATPAKAAMMQLQADIIGPTVATAAAALALPEWVSLWRPYRPPGSTSPRWPNRTATAMDAAIAQTLYTIPDAG